MSDIDWAATRNDLIKQALLEVGVVPLGEDPDADQFKIARDSLDSITKYLQANNLFLWNYSTETIPTVIGQESYGFTNNDAIGVDEIYYLSGSTKVWLERMTLEDYLVLQPTTNAQPTQFYFDRGNRAPAVKLYPFPSTVFNIYVRTARRLKDWDLAADNGAFPQWWFEPLKWKLAANLCYTFQQPLQKIQLMEAKASELMAAVRADNWSQRDKQDICFIPG